MSNTPSIVLLERLRRIEDSLIQLPKRLVSWIRPGAIARGLDRAIKNTLKMTPKVVSRITVAISVLLRLAQSGTLLLIQGLLRLLMLPLHLIKLLPRFSLPIHPARGQFPAFSCVLAVLLASVITLSPDVGNFWSEQTYPAITAIDQFLVPHGISIGPQMESDITPSRPMIAVVFGSIMPDDSVEDEKVVADLKIESDESEEMIAAPQITKLRDVTRPAGWYKNTQAERVSDTRRDSYSIAKGTSSEAYEIRD